MPFLREVLTKLGFKFDGSGVQVAESRLTAYKKQAAAAQRETTALHKNLNQAATAAKGMVLALIGHRAIKALTTDYTTGLDATAKFAASMNMNVETLQALQHAADLEGVSNQELSVGIQKLSVNMREAVAGGQEQIKTFRDIGVEYKNANGTIKTQDELLMAVADRFAASEGGAVKAALAIKLFGKSGAKLVPMLDKGSKGIKEMMAEARKLGGVMNAKQVAEAENFNDEITRTKMVFLGLRNQIAAGLLPTLTSLMVRFRTWAAESGNMERMLNGIKTAAKIAAVVLARMAMGQIVGVFMSMAAAVGAAGNALRLLGIAGAAAQVKMGLLLGVFTLIGLAIWQLWKFANGKGSIFDSFLGSEDKSALLGMFADIKSAALELWAEIKEPLKELGKTLAEAFREIMIALKPILPVVFKIVGFLVKWVIKLLAVVIRVAAWAIKAIVDGLIVVGSVAARIARGIGIVWAAVADVAKTAWEGLMYSFERIGAAIKAVANAIGKVWNTVIGAISKAVDAVWRRVMKVKEFLLGPGSESGDKEYTQGLSPGGGIRRRSGKENLRSFLSDEIKSPGGGGGTTNSVTTGPVSIRVDTAPNMAPGEFETRIKNGVRDGLSDMIRGTYNNRAESVA